MSEMMQQIRSTTAIWKSFSGSSMYTLLFLCSLLYLWLSEKQKSTRLTLIYLTSAVFALFFFPIFSYVASRYFLEDEVYYRFLWLLPMGVVVCYSITRMIDQMSSLWTKVISALLCLIFIAGSGSLIYQNPAITRAENVYQIPESVIEVADELVIPNTFVKAVVPSEMIQFIRQYNAWILMPYGREMLIDRWAMNHELYELMESPEIYWTYLENLCRESKVDYIVLRQQTYVYGMTDEDRYVKLMDKAGYTIYINKDSENYEARMKLLP